MTSPATGFFHFPEDRGTPPERDQHWRLSGQPHSQESAGATDYTHGEPIPAGRATGHPGGSVISPRQSLDGGNWFRGMASSFTASSSSIFTAAPPTAVPTPGRSQLTASLLQRQSSWEQQGTAAVSATDTTATSSQRGSVHRDGSVRRGEDLDEALPDVEEGQELLEEEEEGMQEAAACDTKGFVFGGVNTVVTLPSMVAFANIIFKSPKFAPFMPIIVRLLFLSAGVHQLAFVIWSNVPGAIGQVQDVGLIFLSAMTASIVAYGEAHAMPFHETLSTVMITITGATAVVGIFIMLMARFKVASLVQYVPVPVVGGYLAFVGYFCCVAGVSLATDVTLDTLSDWMGLVSLQSALRLAPMLATWLALHNTVHRISHPLGLPLVICCIPLLFFAVLYVSGHTLSDAQKAGWAPEPVPGGTQPFWAAWEMYDFGNFPANIHWAAVAKQVPNTLALFFVVAFGSCMDIAAIQAECPFELNFDKELGLIGLSNALTGIVGAGFTGSYIFSQTLFNFRWGAWGKSIGVVVSVAEICLFIAPVSVIEYIPNFFFGGLMFWFGVDIAFDWLVTAYGKVRRVEYLIIWFSFIAVVLMGLEGGIAIGCLASALQFTWEYARQSSSSITVVPSMSSNMRTYDQRIVLQLMKGHLITVNLTGYIFFGSALRLIEEVRLLAEEMGAAKSDGTYIPPGGADGGGEEPSGEFNMKQHQAAARLDAVAPSFLVLDFKRVTGFDASSAQAFCGLKRKLRTAGVQLVLCNIRAPYIRRLLAANGVIDDAEAVVREDDDGDEAAGATTDSLFASLDAALNYCEERILSEAIRLKLCHREATEMSLAAVLEAHLDLPSAMLPGILDYRTAASKILPFLEMLDLPSPGDRLFSPGDPVNGLYIIHAGEVRCELDFALWSGVEQSRMSAALQQRSGGEAMQFLRYGPGGILGDTDFFLQQPHSFTAAASKAPCKLWVLSSTNMKRMLRKNPSMVVVIQAMVLRSQCMTAKFAMASMEMLVAAT